MALRELRRLKKNGGFAEQRITPIQENPVRILRKCRDVTRFSRVPLAQNGGGRAMNSLC